LAQMQEHISPHQTRTTSILESTLSTQHHNRKLHLRVLTNVLMAFLLALPNFNHKVDSLVFSRTQLNRSSEATIPTQELEVYLQCQ